MLAATAFAFLLLPQAPSPEPSAAYAQFERATRANNGSALARWVRQVAAPEFSYRSKDGHVYDLEAYAEGLKEQSRSLLRVHKYEQRLVPQSSTGNERRFQLRTEMTGQVRFDTASLRLQDRSTSEDTWRRVGNRWQLVRSVQVQADTQLFPE
jgi:hypothetical protein